MQTRQILKNVLDLKVLLSLLDAIFVALDKTLIANGIWVISAPMWIYYFYKRKDISGEIVFIMYWIIAIIGILYWGITT